MAEYTVMRTKEPKLALLLAKGLRMLADRETSYFTEVCSDVAVNIRQEGGGWLHVNISSIRKWEDVARLNDVAIGICIAHQLKKVEGK